MRTRPEPTIYANCDSWNFIVGKKLVRNSPEMSKFLSLQLNNKKVMHSLLTF